MISRNSMTTTRRRRILDPALKALKAASRGIGVDLGPLALERFERYLGEILAWKGRLNLTGARGADEIVHLHFLDSLLALTVHDIPRGGRVVDVGSGAGFPGVPLKIARPDIVLTLVESSRRRVAFLEHLRAVLEMPNVDIAWARAEALARNPEYRESFGCALERAVAAVGLAAELCLPLVAVGGAAVLLKGPKAAAEVEAIPLLIGALGGRAERCELMSLPGTDRKRVVVVLRKHRSTPPEFPRRRTRMGSRP
jgi:16S rRNA (guanine527-N7)-methyltransferase